VEIAAYELLERTAERAGDDETARVARYIRFDEKEMAGWIAGRWDRIVDQSLAEVGLDGDERERERNATGTGRNTRGIGPSIGSLVGLVGCCCAGYLAYRWLDNNRGRFRGERPFSGTERPRSAQPQAVQTPRATTFAG
jgi:hypothetical protein